MDPHAPLREDVRLLGELLGDCLRGREGDALFQEVEAVRDLAKRAHAGDPDAFTELTQRLSALPVGIAVPIARAFSQFLTLANIAEQHHRIRRRRDYAREASRPQPGSCAAAFAAFRDAGISPAALADSVRALRIELVFTAHPTEIVRRTLLQSHRRIADALAVRDHVDNTPDESASAIDALRREIAIEWQTPEVRNRAVTPLDEVRAGLAVIEQTVWQALPRFMRQLDRALGQPLSLDAAPVRFASWIGGDRDGNPNVTPSVTRSAVWMARWVAADLYIREVDALRGELSLSTATPTVRRFAAGTGETGGGGGEEEPYRRLLREVAARLRATRAHAALQLDGAEGEPPARGAAPYDAVANLRAPLVACYESLVATGNQDIANGRLLDLLRATAAFGLALTPLDLRQDAARHADAVDWLARTWNLGAYADAAEEQRLALLLDAIANEALAFDRLPADTSAIPPQVLDVIDTFRTAAALPTDSLGAYVITMASRPSDVLAVDWLQRLARSPHPQRVVPLFETAADLENGAATLDALFRIPWYRRRIAGEQEVMVGYSDSAKDAGRFAAAWSLYRAQEQIGAVCRAHGVALTLFHGRGGSVGRGGGPTHIAIRSQPPGSINGRLRVTEQGEMIQTKFGLPDIAVRTMEVYATATLEATLLPSAPPEKEWRDAMDRLSQRARQSYRRTVYENPRFLDYFHAATPEPELRLVRIGSRPQRRAGVGGNDVGGLRAIPWQFAWTQTRLLLASWLGVDDALGDALANGEDKLLRTMYERWPFFESTIDLIEMVLAKADARIAAEYDRRLVSGELQPLGDELRQRLARATESVLAITSHRELVESTPVLRRSIDVRNPYVDPINLVQIELLARLRGGDESPELARAFAVTVNGIAAGMRNTG